MKLVECDPIKRNIPARSKQSKVREMLDQFVQSGMKCAEIENWEEISDTPEHFRLLVRNQIYYRNGSKYRNIKISMRTDDVCRMYLIKKEAK